MCHWTMGLNSDKTSEVFVIFAVFLSDFIFFLYHSGTIIQVSSKLWMFLISTSKKVHCAVSSNDQYQRNSFAAEMCCLDPRVFPIGPIVREVIAFPILGTWWDATTQVASQSVHWQASYGILNIFQQRPSAILNFKNFNMWPPITKPVLTPNFQFFKNYCCL